MGDNNPTVEVNGTELEITETEDGFEAREVEDEPDADVWVRAGGSGYEYGFEVPVGGPVALKEVSTGYYASWDTDADRSDMNSTGNSDAQDVGPDEYDGYAYVSSIEIVED